MIEMRLRTRISQEELQAKVGKIVTPKDFNVLLTGPARVLTPAGQPLCIYLPGAIPPAMRETAYTLLHPIKILTQNRGLASGSQRVQRYEGSRNSYSAPVYSAVIGAMDRMGGRFPYCRQTAWTGRHAEQWAALYPYFYAVSNLFAEHVHDRWKRQFEVAMMTHPDWRIPYTPFTTVTVNNTYSTGVHQDDGDLEEGYSCLTTLRRGSYTGGQLVFPEYRVAVDLQDGDVILMDAHQWHGNVELEKQSDDAERISSVLYYRTKLQECGSAEEELERARRAVPLVRGVR